MDEYTIRQAVDLIKAKRLLDARKLLKPVLEVTPSNEAAWVWYTSTFSAPEERLEVMRFASQFCPNSQPIMRGLEKCEQEVQELKAKGEDVTFISISPNLPRISGVGPIDTPMPTPVQISDNDSNALWGEPFSKQVEAPAPKKASDDPSDWINNLRITAAMESEAEAEKLSEEEDVILPSYMLEEEKPAFTTQQEKSVFPQPQVPQSIFTTGVEVTPGVSPYPWEGSYTEETSPETVPSFFNSNFGEELEPVPALPEKNKPAGQTSSPEKARDPYQIPLVLAGSLGAALVLVLALMVVLLFLRG